jgi:hypothetical protein
MNAITLGGALILAAGLALPPAPTLQRFILTVLLLTIGGCLLYTGLTR